MTAAARSHIRTVLTGAVPVIWSIDAPPIGGSGRLGGTSAPESRRRGAAGERLGVAVPADYPHWERAETDRGASGGRRGMT